MKRNSNVNSNTHIKKIIMEDKGLLSCPKLASSELQKSMYAYLYKMYPTPVTPEQICENCENTNKNEIWKELDEGPLRKVIHYKGRAKYVLNKRR